MRTCFAAAGRAAVLVIALSMPTWAGVACPDGAIPNTFASAAFGANAQKCGNVTVNSGVVTMTSPSGAVDAAGLNQFLGNPNITSQFPIPVQATVGSGFGFLNFNANAGDTVSFDWTAQFEQNAFGVVFAVFDNQLQILNFSSPVATTAAANSHIEFNVASTGAHNLGFAAVNVVPCDVANLGSLTTIPNTCAPGVLYLDPNLNVSNLALTPGAPTGAVPEPATVSMLGLGLAAGVLLRLRKRSNA